ncbi:hypothetical protein BJ170DRAFT_125203 [Xylariales sp. AK1849]|nr:hypothetical protein BJ170DRAFT_125203 [Xylariales sp. AK1849]
MASKAVDEKALQPGQLAINTTELPGQNGLALTPITTYDSTEKGPKETSMELHRNSTVSSPSSVLQLNPFDTDIEARTHSSENLNRNVTHATASGKNNPKCTVWPGQDHWKQKARAAKMKRGSCQCMARLSKRTRLIVQILIALLIIGIAVGVGLGISKPLGAGIWKPSGQ